MLVLLDRLDRLDLAIFASFGAFTGIYGRNEPHAKCFGLQIRAIWQQVLATTLVAGGCSLIVAWWRLRPAGSLFHIFAFAAIASIPNQPPLWQGMLVAVITVAFSLLVGMSSRVVRSRRTPWVPPAPVNTSWPRSSSRRWP